MPLPSLTVERLVARPVVLKLRRPVVARIATLTEWPMILVDLYTREGIVGRSYLEPYNTKAMEYLVPALHDLGELLNGRALAPVELFALARKSLHFVSNRTKTSNQNGRLNFGNIAKVCKAKSLQ